MPRLHSDCRTVRTDSMGRKHARSGTVRQSTFRDARSCFLYRVNATSENRVPPRGIQCVLQVKHCAKRRACTSTIATGRCQPSGHVMRPSLELGGQRRSGIGTLIGRGIRNIAFDLARGIPQIPNVVGTSCPPVWGPRSGIIWYRFAPLCIELKPFCCALQLLGAHSLRECLFCVNLWQFCCALQ